METGPVNWRRLSVGSGYRSGRVNVRWPVRDRPAA